MASSEKEYFSIDYEIRWRKGQKNLYLRIRSDGSVLVTAPRHLSRSRVEAFVEEKSAWISRRLGEHRIHARPEPGHYFDGCRLWYLGESHPVARVPSSRDSIRFDGDSFTFHCRDEANFSKVLNRFYLQRARLFIAPKVDEWADRMKLFPKDIRFRRYRSRWGCCSAEDSLSFNTALIRYDPSLIDYVIVHELAHIRYKNHSPDFWRLVEQFVPDWKTLRKRLM